MTLTKPDTRPPRQPRTGLTSTGVRKAASKSARSRSREFAVQALYQYLVGRNDADAIDRFTRDLAGFNKADSAHYDALLHGCIEEATALDALVVPLLDRKLGEISPVEHSILWIGTYEFKHCLDVPWRVVINECGGTRQELRRHRRPQVRQRRARQGRRRPAPARSAGAARGPAARLSCGARRRPLSSRSARRARRRHWPVRLHPAPRPCST